MSVNEPTNVLIFDPKILCRFDIQSSMSNILLQDNRSNISPACKFLTTLFDTHNGNYNEISKSITDFLSKKKIQYQYVSGNIGVKNTDNTITEKKLDKCRKKIYDRLRYACDMTTFACIIDKISRLEITECDSYYLVDEPIHNASSHIIDCLTYDTTTIFILINTLIVGNKYIFRYTTISVGNFDKMINIDTHDIHQVCLSGDTKLVELMVLRNDMLYAKTNDSGKTLLHIACARNDFNMTKLLLDWAPLFYSDRINIETANSGIVYDADTARKAALDIVLNIADDTGTTPLDTIFKYCGSDIKNLVGMCE